MYLGLIFQIKSFLQVYNRITEVCFKACVDNLSSRNCSVEEDKCVDNCFRKFSSANQRLLATYVEQQAAVNQRRAAELERLEREALQKQQQEQQAAATVAAEAQTNDNNITTRVTPSISLESGSYISPDDVSVSPAVPS